MVVNEEKTGQSREFIELNSRSFHVPSGSFVRKPVFSFLRPGPTPGCLLSEILKGLKGSPSSVVLEAIVMMRHEIVHRGVCPQSVPQTLFKSLLTRRWFRQSVLYGPEVVESGPPRAWPVVTLSVRPADCAIRFYNDRVREGLWYGASLFRGKPLPPYRVVLKKVPPQSPGRVRLRLTRRRWVWRWPRHLWSLWEGLGLPLQRLRGVWEEDHPDLATSVSVATAAFVPTPLSLLYDAVRPDGVNWV
jgi:hypothetical protein